MTWDETYYRQSVQNLPLEVRLKAIEIAKALLEEGYDEGKAIRIAIAKAKKWAERSELALVWPSTPNFCQICPLR